MKLLVFNFRDFVFVEYGWKGIVWGFWLYKLNFWFVIVYYLENFLWIFKFRVFSMLFLKFLGREM